MDQSHSSPVPALSIAKAMPSSQTSPQGHEAMSATAPEAHLQMLSEKLNLTEDQKVKLKPIFQEQAQQMKALHDDSSLTPEQKAAKKKAILFWLSLKWRNGVLR